MSVSSLRQEEISLEDLLAKLPGNSGIRLTSKRIQECSTTGELERIIGIVIYATDGKTEIQGDIPNLTQLAYSLNDMSELLLLVRLSKETIKRIFLLDDFQHQNELDPHAKIINALGNFTTLLGHRGFYSVGAGVLVDFWNDLEHISMKIKNVSTALV